MNTQIEKRAGEELEKGFDEAEALLKDADKVEEFLGKLEKKLKVIPSVGEGLSHIPVFISLVKSYINKEYTEIPLGTIIAIVSALLYFLSPIDLIPDFIPGLGHMDDVAVIGACLLLVDSDIKDYMEWRDSRASKANDAD